MGAYEHGSITIDDKETGMPTTVKIKGAILPHFGPIFVSCT